MLKTPVVVNPLNKEAHATIFKEQVAVLHPAGFDGDNLFVVRSWYKVGEHSTVDAGFEWLDDKIESGEVVGVFHTHPSSCNGFSPQDDIMQRSFAKTYGKRLLWHGVQAYNEDYFTLRCVHMLVPGYVMTYNFGTIESDIHDNVLSLPLPSSIDVDADNRTFTMEMSQ